MTEIAIFGGTFDPPTRAHEAIIDACLAQPTVDEVWVMPSGYRADKPGMQSNAVRTELLEVMRAVEYPENERIKITDIEQRLPQPTETCHTVDALEVVRPNDRFWFVFGADSYQNMPDWHRGTELRSRIGMLLIPRPGAELPPEADRLKHLAIDERHAHVSSTAIRAACALGIEIPGVNPAVAAYITKHELYPKALHPARMGV